MSQSSGRLAFVVADIAAAGRLFIKESQAYSQGMNGDGAATPFGCPSGGSEEFDQLLQTTLRMIGEVHVQIAQAMENHGSKLSLVAEMYKNTEEQNRDNIAQLFHDAETAPLVPELPDGSGAVGD